MKESKVLTLSKVLDHRGNLTFIESGQYADFDFKRVYWIYDVPGGEIRGSHAYINLEEIIVAISGSFDVIINDGKKEIKYSLNRSYFGLYIPEMMWRTLNNFSTNAVCLIIASEDYDEKDYIRDWEEFVTLKKCTV